MPTVQQLLDRRANVWSQMTEIIDLAESEGRDLTAEEAQKYDAAEADLEKITTSIDRAKRHAQHADAQAHVESDPNLTPPAERGDDAPTLDEQYGRAFRSYLRGGISVLDVDERRILQRGVSNDPEVRALAVGTGSAGGYFVPPGFRDAFIIKMKEYGAVQRVAQVIETDTGANLQWPTMDDTSNVGALLAENTQMSEQDVAIGTAALDAYLYYSKLTRIPIQLIQDAAIDPEQAVKDAHAERVGRILNQHLTTGTGTAQPDGIVTSATSGVTAASTTAITADELLDLVHSVDPAYRASPRARFMLSDTALKGIRKLKDSTGQYLWQPNVQAGTAASLFGYPYEINQDMAVPATGVKSVLFGDFYAGYVVRIVRALQTVTFSERYMDYLQVGHASYLRADGTLQNGSAYKALTQA